MLDECKIVNLYSLENTIAKDLLSKFTYPWEVLPEIENFIINLGKTLNKEEYEQVSENVWIAKDANIYESACIKGPTIIDKGAELRHCAFIRGKAIVGKNAVVGNSTELKNAILFDNVQVAHYNYVGDSILGYKAHLGAGTKAANIKADKKDVVIKNGKEQIETNLRKVGAMIGDYSEVGCNSVLSPGAVIGKNTNIYPLTFVRGVVPPNSIYKGNIECKNNIVPKKS